MKTILTNRWPGIIMTLSFAVITMACGRSAPLQDGSAVASEPTAAWVTAFNAGDPAALAAVYAENARSLPPGGPALTGRSQIDRTGGAILAKGA